MSADRNKASARRFVEEAFNKGNLGIIDEMVTADYVDHSLPPQLPGCRDGLRQFAAMYRAAFPDIHYHVEDEVAEGEMVVQRAMVHGTMKGDFLGMPATGKQASWSEIHIGRFVDGKLAEHWGNTDQVGMLQQLGLMPTPGA